MYKWGTISQKLTAIREIISTYIDKVGIDNTLDNENIHHHDEEGEITSEFFPLSHLIGEYRILSDEQQMVVKRINQELCLAAIDAAISECIILLNQLEDSN
jgi:hypothetical protein